MYIQSEQEARSQDEVNQQLHEIYLLACNGRQLTSGQQALLAWALGINQDSRKSQWAEMACCCECE